MFAGEREVQAAGFHSEATLQMPGWTIAIEIGCQL
jgi:hypothetical protein